jgi:hypothetical protein
MQKNKSSYNLKNKKKNKIIYISLTKDILSPVLSILSLINKMNKSDKEKNLTLKKMFTKKIFLTIEI